MKSFTNGFTSAIYKMGSWVKSELSFMAIVLFQNIFHEEYVSDNGVVFLKNPGKKLCRHGKSTFHKKAILAKANLTIEESIASKNNKDWAHANKLCIGKLVKIVHFLPKKSVSKTFISQICWISFYRIIGAHYKTVLGYMSKKYNLYFTWDVRYTYSFTRQLFFSKI